MNELRTRKLKRTGMKNRKAVKARKTNQRKGSRAKLKRLMRPLSSGR
uniref:Uncharacterized protein n=1 Tax=Arundo donax TaxID=35708 RepID=A0A0A9EEW8_ARUDO